MHYFQAPIVALVFYRRMKPFIALYFHNPVILILIMSLDGAISPSPFLMHAHAARLCSSSSHPTWPPLSKPRGWGSSKHPETRVGTPSLRPCAYLTAKQSVQEADLDV